MKELPKCPTSLLGVLDEKLRELAEVWATSETRPRIGKRIAGAFYSLSGIPGSWVAKLAQKELILSLADRLFMRRKQLGANQSFNKQRFVF